MKSYLKQRRVTARKTGMCSTCCKRKPDPGRKTCRECLGNKTTRYILPFCMRCLACHKKGVCVAQPWLYRRAM